MQPLFCHFLYCIMLLSLHSYLLHQVMSSFVAGCLFYLTLCPKHLKWCLPHTRHSVNTCLMHDGNDSTAYESTVCDNVSELHTIVTYHISLSKWKRNEHYWVSSRDHLYSTRHLNTQKQAHRCTTIHAYTMNKIIKQSSVDSITHLFTY